MESVYLQGSERVAAAARSMQDAASTIGTQVAYLDELLTRHLITAQELAGQLVARPGPDVVDALAVCQRVETLAEGERVALDGQYDASRRGDGALVLTSSGWSMECGTAAGLVATWLERRG